MNVVFLSKKRALKYSGDRQHPVVGFLEENSRPLEPHGPYHSAYPGENFSLHWIKRLRIKALELDRVHNISINASWTWMNPVTLIYRDKGACAHTIGVLEDSLVFHKGHVSFLNQAPTEGQTKKEKRKSAKYICYWGEPPYRSRAGHLISAIMTPILSLISYY